MTLKTVYYWRRIVPIYVTTAAVGWWLGWLFGGWGVYLGVVVGTLVGSVTPNVIDLWRFEEVGATDGR